MQIVKHSLAAVRGEGVRASLGSGTSPSTGLFAASSQPMA
jgi:hypothetical protein